MNVGKLRRALEGLASALGPQEAKAADCVRTFARGFSASPALSVTEFFGKLDMRSPRSTRSDERIDIVANAVQRFLPLAQAACTPAVFAVLNHLSTFASDHRDVSILDYLRAVDAAFTSEQTAQIDAYVRRLRDVVHDSTQFKKVFDELSSDPRMKREAVVAVASGFAFDMAKSTMKRVALDRIWRMHSASEVFAAKSRAMKGKSAA